MSTFYIVYHSLIFSAFCLGLYCYLRRSKLCGYLTLLLGITLIVELLAEVLIRYKIEFTWVYHIYTPVNYALFALHFRQFIIKKPIKKTINISIIFFFVFSYFLSAVLYKFKFFPGICITVDGLMLIIICIYYLLNINPEKETAFFLNPNVWIAIGVLFFFGGTTFFNGIYTTLLGLDKAKALQLFGIINKPLNILLYSCINIGMLCFIAKKNSITQP